MLYIAFYTLGTRYEAEAARLRGSLDALGLPHEIVGVPDRGSWAANAHQTASFIAGMQETHPGETLVYLDADAYVWSRPDMFDDLTGNYDIGVHYFRGKQLANGTLWLPPTDACRAIIADYRRRCDAEPDFADEQQFLARAVKAHPAARVYNLPPAYCWIDSFMAKDVQGGVPVIEHLQASREVGGRDGARASSLLPSRRERLRKVTNGSERIG